MPACDRISEMHRRARRLQVAAILAGAAAAAIAGWSVFWFLTDDAYIAFRYVRNAMLGHGYVWNPPPFRPVEGYTSFLWVVILHGVWRWLGIPPPEAANWISLALGLATLALVAALVLRLRLPVRLERARLPLLAGVLLGTVGNRTFLAWLSSGLETSLMTFWIVLWLLLFQRRTPDSGAGWTAGVSAAAAGAALTRPEGLVLAAATAGVLAIHLRERGRPHLRDAQGAWPLLAVPAHLLWRHGFYGAWLPNTYYAKGGDPWPEAGVRYLASFALEYALWIPAIAVGAALVRIALRGGVRERLRGGFAVAAGVGAVVFVAAWYTFAAGGDHFEYRIYHSLVPLAFVSIVWALARLDVRPAAAIALLAAAVVASWPLPWVHWLETRHLATRRETHLMRVPIAHHFPPPLRTYAGWFDRLQDWLIGHAIGVRHQEHAVFERLLSERLGALSDAPYADPARRSILRAGRVGVLGWSLPHVAVIDVWGLNDRVIARSRPRHERTGRREMAHDRRPPEGYVACFRPNLFEGKLGEVLQVPRTDPAMDEEIRACESRDWPSAGSGG